MFFAQILPKPVAIENSSVKLFKQQVHTLPLITVILPVKRTALGETALKEVMSIKIGLNFNPYFSLSFCPMTRPILMVSPTVGQFILTTFSLFSSF